MLNKIVFYILNDLPSLGLAIDITILGSFYQIFRFRTNSRKVEIDTNVSINKNDLMKIRFPLIKENADLSFVDKVVFAFYFTPR